MMGRRCPVERWIGWAFCEDGGEISWGEYNDKGRVCYVLASVKGRRGIGILRLLGAMIPQKKFDRKVNLKRRRKWPGLCEII